MNKPIRPLGMGLSEDDEIARFVESVATRPARAEPPRTSRDWTQEQDEADAEDLWDNVPV